MLMIVITHIIYILDCHGIYIHLFIYTCNIVYVGVYIS